MNRYKSSSKLNKNIDNDIIFQDDFDNDPQPQKQNQNQTIANLRYKSIPSKAKLLQNLQQTIQHLQPNEFQDFGTVQKHQELKIIKRDSSTEEVRLNNFFGSKKTLQRKINNSKTSLSPQYNPQSRQKKQIRVNTQQSTNQKLKEMILKQIKDRERWENLVQNHQKQQQKAPKIINHQELTDNVNQKNVKTIDSTDHAELITAPLIVINNNESLKKMSSQQKLEKISQQKFAAINFQKNSLFNQPNNEDNQYINATEQNKQAKTQVIEVKKKKRNITELKPLKKKPSTFEVLNQNDLGSRPSQSQIISIADNPSIMSSAPIKKQESQQRISQKIIKLPKTRLIGVDIKDFLSFAKKPVSQNKFIQAVFHRQRTCINKAFFPLYRIQIDQVNALYAQKTMRGYDILLGDDENNVPIGKIPRIGSVKGNFLGSYYDIFLGSNQDEILATVFYQSQFTTKSTVRNVEIYVKNPEIESDSIYYGQFYDHKTNLKTLFNMSQNRGKIQKYISKQPFYNSQSGIYQLDFGTNKVTMPSVKNVVMVDFQNPKHKVLVFGKCGYNDFYLRVENPLSPVIAMGYLMTSFNFKWVTQ